MTDSPTLAYWHIRGLAAPPRALLTFLNVKFNNVTYKQGGPPDFSRTAWTDVKPTLAKTLDFPNLPYFLDGDVAITQSRAILMHIARVYGKDALFHGVNEADKAKIDMLLNVCGDFSGSITRIAYNPDYADLVVEYRASTFPVWAAQFSAFLGGKPFLMGDKPCVADFCLWELVDQSIKMGASLEDHTNLIAFQKRMADGPNKAYIASDMHKYTMNNASSYTSRQGI